MIELNIPLKPVVFLHGVRSVNPQVDKTMKYSECHLLSPRLLAQPAEPGKSFWR